MRMVGPCAKCGCEIWLPEELENASRRSDKITFYCPYGHSMRFAERPMKEAEKRNPPPQFEGNVISMEFKK